MGLGIFESPTRTSSCSFLSASHEKKANGRDATDRLEANCEEGPVPNVPDTMLAPESGTTAVEIGHR